MSLKCVCMVTAPMDLIYRRLAFKNFRNSRWVMSPVPLTLIALNTLLTVWGFIELLLKQKAEIKNTHSFISIHVNAYLITSAFKRC